MGKIAFVFSGQGDQYPGMGKELYQKEQAAERVFRLCDAIRPGTSAQCFGGSVQELAQTKHTQPCLYAMEWAAAAVLQEKGLKPDAVAGFSLGEVVAAAYSGVFSYETGFRLVCKRGELMQHEAEKRDTFMAAVLRLEQEQLETICKAYPSIYPVNFNCPGQITVSGLAQQREAFAAAVKAAGGRLLPLKLGGAFHSPFMEPAASAFAQELAAASCKTPTIPLYSNVTAKPYGEDIAGLLSRQIASPVQWEKIIRNMIAEGIECFIEIGPGKTLCNMIRKIDATVAVRSTEEAISEVERC